MKRLPSDQPEQENDFGRSCLWLRKAMSMTQHELGQILGMSKQAIQQWEYGMCSPTPEHLKRLLALCVQRHAFAPGHEYEEAEHLWQVARQKVAFDASWMQAQLAESYVPLAHVSPQLESDVPLERQEPPLAATRLDWRNALDVGDFYGREAEHLQLEQWVIHEHCQVVSVLGMGGIGKSALVVTFMYQVASSFESVVFRSVRDAPPCQDLLTDILQALSPQPLPAMPASVDRRLALLLECLQTRRCLLVLDNLETLLQPHDPQSHYLPGYEDYGVLLRRVAEATHQSCLLLTSREIPAELVQLEDSRPSVRSLHLAGLERDACEQLFEEREVFGTAPEQARLIELYVGNPLALKIVAETIVALFGGEIAAFLEQGEVIFSSIRDLLDEQFARLSSLEQSLLTWLAIVRKPIGFDDLLAMLVSPIPGFQMKETLEALQRHSLIEQRKQQETYTLQSVVLEYVTETLVKRVCEQIQSETLDHLLNYALEQASAREYVRQTQDRLIVAPIILRLRALYQHTDAVEKQLLHLLNQLRTWEQEAQGYGPANLIALLRELRGHLEGVDLSRLAIREAYLQGVEMQDASLAGAILHGTVFTEAFDVTWAVAISRDGQYWAAGSRQGEVRIWREGGQILHLVWQAHTDNTHALAFNPDGRTLATGSWDGTVKLWDLEYGTLLWTGWHTNSINSVAFAPDGHTLASGGNDAIVQLWDVASGTNVQTLAGQSGAIYSVAWSPEGDLLVSSSFDG
ncbi:MAG: helix-turn-helix domain-containing protein, partial [Chloroflexi bacterium]|nr:helix-turn-helix domain-containing protein [Chloroflexota bacterium]